MIRLLRFRAALLFVTALVTGSVSCGSGKLSYRSVEYKAVPHIQLGTEELKDSRLNQRTDTNSRFTLRVTVYSYSSGKETFSMAGNNEFSTVAGSGVIKALVELMDGDRVVKAEFVEVSGSSRDELILNLSKSVSALSGN